MKACILAQLQQHFLLPELTAEPLHHNEHQSFLLRPANSTAQTESQPASPQAWVLKAHCLDYAQQLQNEYALLGTLQEHAQAVSPLLGPPLQVENRLYTLQVCLAGHMYIQAPPEAYVKLGQRLNSLHHCPVDLPLQSLNPEQLLQDWPLLMHSTLIQARHHKPLEYYRSLALELKVHQPVLLHFDAHWGNIVEKQGQLYLLDWEEAGHGPAVLDLATCYMHLLKLEDGERKLEALLQGYAEPIDRHNLHRATLLRLLHLLCKISQRLHLPLLHNADQILERYLGYMQRLWP